MPYTLAARTGHPALSAARHLFLGAPDPAELAPAPALPRSVVLPHGRAVAPLPRGVHWAPALVGAAAVAFLVDSTGDCRGQWRLVPLTAPAEIFAAVERELADLLDRLDPLPAVRLVAG